MEYLSALKNEQTARIVMRDTALYVFLGTIFAVYAAEGQATNNPGLVAIIRMTAVALSAIMLSIYLSNDYYVSKIGDFVSRDAGAGDFRRWEDFHRSGLRHHLQKFSRTSVVVLLFGGWTAFEAFPLLNSHNWMLRAAVGTFSAVVALQLLVFLTFALKPRPKIANPALQRAS